MKTLLVLIALACLFAAPGFAQALTLTEKNQPKAVVYIEAGGLTPAQQAAMTHAAKWLSDSLKAATSAVVPTADKAPATGTPAIILTTARAQPELAKKLNLKTELEDGYAIVTTGDRLYLIGANAFAVRHAVAHVLRELGFRFYAPSPTWHVVPKLDRAEVNLNLADAPDIQARKIWYAYGQPDKALDENYKLWVMGNRLSLTGGLIQTGHSYAHIINRNSAEFDKHPEYFALLENGERDIKRAPQARKFCYSNPGLIDLVARDRIKLLEESRKENPLQYMVSVDPSDGQGTCHCPDCVKLGTTTDRVFHLANQVAIRLRKVYPDAWVGLYAYSSHRLPPTIQLEPNVYVQVALAFNRTQYSLPELVDLWSQKAGAVGLREYYGVEAWDWGLPGRMRGAKVAYHKEWIPFYAKRKLNAVNAETNANWGGQSLGLFIAAQLMWDTSADTDALAAAFYKDLFGPAAGPMQALYSRFESSPPLNPATLTPMFDDLNKALALANTPEIRARIVDMMAYLLYVDTYRRFELVMESQPSRNDIYYQSLRELMNYAWRIKDRDTVHYYALARRLCNSLPLNDKRPEFNLVGKDVPTIWKEGEQYTDQEILAQFNSRFKDLKEDKTPYTTYSRFFEPVRSLSQSGPASGLLNDQTPGLTRSRTTLQGYLVPAGQLAVTLQARALNKPAAFKVYAREQEVLHEAAIPVSAENTFTDIKFTLPKAGEFRFEFIGEVILSTPPTLPILFEASPARPAWIDYAGPHYFYVPKGATQICVDAEPRMTYYIPGNPARQETSPATRVPGASYTLINVPPDAAGKLWRTDANTRAKISFLNVPPFLCPSPTQIFLPREVAELDNLTTAK